jgi:ribose transport system substrate-binding protein
MMRKMAILLIVVMMVVAALVGCDRGENKAAPGEEMAVETAEKVQHKYYYVAPLMAHPYIYDQHLGFKYAAQQFGAEITRLGPDGWDPPAAAQAMEQAIAKKPDGIVVCLWGPGMIPAIKEARAQGIPVICTEAYLPDSGVFTYIGLDNYACGRDTAIELIERAGTEGNYVMQGNWGASNTEAKLAGFNDYIQANSNWVELTKVDDKANTEVSIEGAKAAFNNFKNIDAYVGIDSSSAPGIGAAMEELGIEPGSITVITHDREDATLEFIEAGYVTASLINKTAMQAYLAIAFLELWHNYGFADAPVSGNNQMAGFDIMPQFCYTGAVVIDKSNVEYFMHDKMDTYDTPLYK